MRPELSVVIPVYNEAPNLEPLHQELTDSLARWGRPYELIFVDDGSRDGSVETLERMQQRDPHVRVVILPSQLRPDGGVLRRLRLCAWPRHRHLRRRPPERSPPTSRCWSRASTKASTSSAGGGDDRKDRLLTRRLPSVIANRLISRATGVRAARLRVLAEGVPRGGREAAAAVRRDAPLHSRHRQRDRRSRGRGGRQPPRAARREPRSTASRGRSA